MKTRTGNDIIINFDFIQLRILSITMPAPALSLAKPSRRKEVSSITKNESLSLKVSSISSSLTSREGKSLVSTLEYYIKHYGLDTGPKGFTEFL